MRNLNEEAQRVIDQYDTMLEFDYKKALAAAMLGTTLATASPNMVGTADAKPAAVKQVSGYPSNLWMGLVAEDTGGNYDVYLAIASVVRNRLNKGLGTGLVALKRKNLSGFVNKEKDYLLKTKKIDLEDLSKKAIGEVFNGKKDTVSGATHYEHTGKYPTPSWAKDMNVVRKMFPGTKNEITFYKEK